MRPLKQTNIIGIIDTQAIDKLISCKLTKSDFLAAVCHDLKTPLSSIIGLSELMRSEKFDPESMQECIDDINNSALEMLDLVHDLLDAKQTITGDFSVNKSSADITHLIKRAIRLNSNYAFHKKIKISHAIDENITTINTDPKRLKQALTNLISNSVKYSKENTEIKVSVQKLKKNNAEFLEIIVSDQGLGMTEWQIAIALQKYRVIENDNSSSVDSFGLGLPIVKNLVELLGGEIDIKSKINEGTIVKLVLPC